jgi:purine-binding chemotaxis protein CheW
MRPLPVEALPAMPPFVAGVAVVRAEPVPVVDLEALLGGRQGEAAGRFVTVRSEAGTFMLAVTEVLGVRELPAGALQELPLLLGAEAASLAAAVAAHDQRLLTLLSAGRLVPTEVWQAMGARGAGS